ncbi:unnamed protein product [Peronospora effusa]|uniref:Uncharacterized protein n=1 Tax=Peronospora effusa TaxID=542832 RepID=A0A3R7W5E2_9STRA|nr:hypothetical protein DD237_002429 [Peronospora effusa]CAI5720498.1 unnamed protein product [Peronospora effusa]
MGHTNKLDQLTNNEKEELPNNWELTDEASSSVLETSTGRLLAWRKSGQSPDKLFTVLGIDKAMDKEANSLLITANLDRWNFYMELFYDGTGRYNFVDKLKEVVTAFCKDVDQANLISDHLVWLLQTRDHKKMQWLHEMKEPKDVYNEMGVGKEFFLFSDPELVNWVTYVDTFNDLYPQHQTTLSACFDSEEELMMNILLRQIKYPNRGIRKRMLDEILKSWADAKPSLSPGDVFDRFKKALKEGEKLLTVEKGKELSTVEEGKGLLTVEKGKELSSVEKGKELSTVKEGEELSTVSLFGLQNYMKLLNVGKQENEKSKDVVALEKLFKKFYKAKERKDPILIDKLGKLLNALEPKNPSKRKSESSSDDARDRQRRRVE